MILTKNLYLRYVREYFALSDVNLEVLEGEKIAFVGGDGSGKTSLIRILAKLEEPTSGEVYIKGVSLDKIDYKTDLSIGYLPVLPIYLKNKTVYENFVYILKQHKLPKGEIESKINKVLIDFNIERFKDVRFDKLSLFEKYVVSFARLALRDIQLLLVDNIFEKLLPDQQIKIVKLIETMFLHKPNLTSIVATSSTVIAGKLSNRRFYFQHGTLSQTPDENIM